MNVYERSCFFVLSVLTTLGWVWTISTYDGLVGWTNIQSLTCLVGLVAIFCFGRRFAANSQAKWWALIVTALYCAYTLMSNPEWSLMLVLLVLVTCSVTSLFTLSPISSIEVWYAVFPEHEPTAPAWEDLTVEAGVSIFSG